MVLNDSGEIIERELLRTPKIRQNMGGATVRGFKAKASQLIGMNIWQRNYYERIIRNEVELEQVGKYIYDNPQNWEQDEEFRII
jgi:REP element-mobilizing transposase RayT